MIRCPFYLVDAFPHRPLSGNPAGVCILEGPVADDWMQAVAAEVNQAETAFVWPIEGGYSLRWFTPTIEVALCGHATLAAAAAIGGAVRFHTLSGWLSAEARGSSVEMDFPAEQIVEGKTPFDLPGSVWQGANRLDWFVVLDQPQRVRDFVPDFSQIEAAGMRGLCITATSDMPSIDFISRFLAPQTGVLEDSVTGSTHCGLAGLWADRLGRSRLTGYQASKRGGCVQVESRGDRVTLAGQAVIVVEGVLCA